MDGWDILFNTVKSLIEEHRFCFCFFFFWGGGWKQLHLWNGHQNSAGGGAELRTMKWLQGVEPFWLHFFSQCNIKACNLSMRRKLPFQITCHSAHSSAKQFRLMCSNHSQNDYNLLKQHIVFPLFGPLLMTKPLILWGLIRKEFQHRDTFPTGNTEVGPEFYTIRNCLMC